MSVITLTQGERDKFAAWCEQEMKSNELMCEQLSKLGLPGELVARDMRQKNIAYMIVAKILRSIEDMTIC